MDNEEIYEDEAGNRCKKLEIVEIETDFIDLSDPELNTKRKICPATRQQSLKDLDSALHIFDVLFDPDKTENFLLGLKPEERKRIYDHNLYTDKDKETGKEN